MKILIIHPNLEIRDLIHLFLESNYSCAVHSVASPVEGLELLRAHEDWSAVISDFIKTDPASYISMYQYLNQERPDLPFILCSDSPPGAFDIFQKHPPYGVINKTQILESLSSIIPKILTQPEQSEYVRISIATVLRHGLLSCDLYMKVNDTKYLKAMREGDLFEASDFFRFDSKKMDFLYIKASDAPTVLGRMTQGIVRLSTRETSSELAQSMHISENVLSVISDFNQTLGFTPEVQKLTQESISLAIQGIRRNPGLAKLFSQIDVDSESYLASHSVTLAHLSCGIASLMKWANESIFYKLALASFLHDLTLQSDQLAKLDSMEELHECAGLSEDEKKRWLKHPEEASLITKLIPDVPQEVITVIRQHHERPDGTGFPDKITHASLHPLSAVLIVAEHIIAFRQKVSFAADIQSIVASFSPEFRVGHCKTVIERILEAAGEPA